MIFGELRMQEKGKRDELKIDVCGVLRVSGCL